MTIATITNNRHQISPELQEWLECKDFVLSLKAANFRMFPVDISSLRLFHAQVEHPLDVKHYSNRVINEELRQYNFKWFEVIDAARQSALAIEEKMTSDFFMLHSTSLSSKREVLRHLQIIPTSIAAAYIGVTEDDLNEMKREMREPFGKHYAGGYCYSMEELNLIANNISWLWKRAAMAADERTKIRNVEPTVLDHVVLVDELTAIMFTNMVLSELKKTVPHSTLSRRRYRLADLEKIRIAKLNAT